MIVDTTYRPLDKLQSNAVRFAHDFKYLFGLFMDAGAGKTLTTIRLIAPVRRKQFLPALIFCRRDDYLTWKLELMREGWSEDDMFFIHHKDSKNQEFIDTPKAWNFVTYDLVKGKYPRHESGKKKKRSRTINLTDAGQWVEENQHEFEIVAGDELHMIKSWDSYRTKVVHSLIKPIPRRIGMTATPQTNKLMDPFSIGLFCDRGKTFGTDHYKFLRKYFINVPGSGWFPKREAKEQIREKFQRFSYCAKVKVDVIERPPIIKGVPMMGKQRRLYEQVLNDWELELDNGQILEYKYVMSKMHKLKQIASGFYYKEDGTAVRFPCKKLDLVREHFLSPDYFLNRDKIVLYGSYREEIDMLYDLMQKLNITAIKYDMTAPKQKEEARLAFQNQKEIKTFIINQEKATGMNELMVAFTAAYFSRSYKVTAEKQSKGRILRKGSEIHEFIEYYDYMTEKTVDPLIRQALYRKVDIAQYVMQLANRGHSVRSITS